jgi:uncharacterized protein
MSEQTTLPPSARKAIVAALVALLLGGLMNAGSLADTAQRQPFGWQRTVAVAATGPLETIASVTRLDRLHSWLSTGVGGWLRPETIPVRDLADAPPTGGPAGEAPPPTGEATPREATPGEAPPSDLPESQPTPDGEPEPEFNDDSPRRRPDDADPLRVWVTGDSLVEALGGPLDAALSEWLAADVRTDPRYSTGLARPDYFDWPAYAAETLADADPDVVVLMIGANDDQDMRGGDGIVGRHDAQWSREYQARARELLDALATEGRDVFWVGLPRMQQDDFDVAMREIDAIQREVSEQTPGVRHVPTRDLVSDDGEYATYLDTGVGVERVRRSDGVHLTPAGGGLLARQRLAALIGQRWTAPD